MEDNVKIKCRECTDSYYRRINFEGVSYEQCPGCGKSGFPKTLLLQKLQTTLTWLPDSGSEKCPKCRILLKPAKTTLKTGPLGICEACDILWAKREDADKLTSGLQDINTPKEEKKRINFFQIFSVIFVSIAGMYGMYYFAYSLSGSQHESILIAVCVGLPTLYLLNLALHGLAPNMDRNSNGEMTSDLEHLGSVTGELWQEIRPFVFGGIIFFGLGMWVLFNVSLPRAQLYRFMGWMQKPYRNHLDAVNSNDKAALARMCDYYRKAQATNPRIFDTTEATQVDSICQSARTR